MSKKDLPFFVLLVKSPWWLSLIFALSSYVGFRWILPSFLEKNPVAKELISLSVQMAPFFGLLFLGAALVSGVRELLTNRQEKTSVYTPLARPPLARRTPAPKSQGSYSASDNKKPTQRNNLKRPTEWSEELLRSLDWKRFEELSTELFRAIGFEAVICSAGPDGGIDVRLYNEDKSKPAVIAQCKAWVKTPVGVKTLRELRGVMAHEAVNEGIVLTTNLFTDEAIAFAKTNDIDAVDGKRFIEMIRTLNAHEQQRLLEFATTGDYLTPSCPSCGIKLIRRSGSFGEFWGCMNFPKCRYKLRNSI